MYFISHSYKVLAPQFRASGMWFVGTNFLEPLLTPVVCLLELIDTFIKFRKYAPVVEEGCLRCAVDIVMHSESLGPKVLVGMETWLGMASARMCVQRERTLWKKPLAVQNP